MACSALANALRKDSPWLVVLLMHNLRKGGAIPLDAILSIRAMAQEVTQAGYQFIISFQVSSTSHRLTSLALNLPPGLVEAGWPSRTD